MRPASALLGLILAASTTATGLAAGRDNRVLAACQAARAGELALLGEVVGIDSGTGDAAGAARVQAVLGARLKALGASITSEPSEAPSVGGNLVATLAGTGRGRILIIAHVDTVFPAGAVAQRPFRMDAERAYGPGVDDEKGGAVQAVVALKILRDLGERDYAKITLLLEAGEETGSPGARRLIDRLVREHDVELNVEPGDAPDSVTVWRKGSATIHLEVHGRAAHAGVAPQDGRNAAVELLNQLRTVERFAHSGDDLTVNLTTLKAGDRVNVIPDLATADVNYRVRNPAQFAQVREAFEASARTPSVPETHVDVTVAPAFPPLAENAATRSLAERAKAIYAGLGMQLGTAGNGGASESALAAAAGTPALDGLGPVGGGFHSAAEHLELKSLTPRLYLLVQLLRELGRDPPRR